MNRFLIIATALFTLSASAQVNSVAPSKSFQNTVKWAAANPFEHKVFIENKGQFEGRTVLKNSEIKFAVSSLGTEIFFTDKGLTYSHNEFKKMSNEEWEKKEKEERKRGKESEKEINEELYGADQKYIHMEWLGANADVEIVAAETTGEYYTYPNHKDLTAKSSFKAAAYKKLTYKNLYPNIDVEYIIPQDKSGIKYSFILHPGADASVIKMKYAKTEGMLLNGSGDLQIKTSFGNITDHAPFTFYKGGQKINSVFELNGNTVSFQMAAYDNSQTVVLDPWTSVPVFSAFNSAYDVEYDAQGNVYIYGGAQPFQEIKFNSAGVLQWVFTHSLISPTWFSGFYGDFAVDAATGTAYMVEGVAGLSGAKVAKVNSAGTMVGMFMGNPAIDEMWRIVFNNCTKQAIIAGGGHNGAQACILDTNVANFTAANVLGSTDPNHDFKFLALDDQNNCFMSTAKSVGNAALFNNIMLKCPANTLSPTAYMVPDGYTFLELLSVKYVNNQVQGANGMNGMAVNTNFLVTYDGSVLKKWDKNTGSMLNSVVVTGTKYWWGGLALDECDNIYLGAMASVKKYDANLNLVSSTTVTNDVYDVHLGPLNKLYVCGDGFVSEMQLNTLPCSSLNTTVQITNAGCSALGSATVTPTGGNAPYTITWNTTPVQTGPVASNLPAGTYIATITDNSCIQKIEYDTVVITSGGLPNLAVNSVTICDGNSATLTASGANTYSWSPATGLNTTSGPTVIANPNATTTYTVTGTITGCSGIITATITVNALPVLVVNSATICAGASVTLTASGANTYTWNTGATTATLTVTPSVTTNYIVSGTNLNGCVSSDTAVVTVSPGLSITAGNNGPLCASATLNLTCNTGSTFSWSGPGSFASSVQNPQIINAQPNVSGTYTIVAYNSAGCMGTATTNVIINPLPVPVISNNGPLCANQNLNLNASGGIAYAWTGPNGFSSTQQNPNIVSVTTSASGTYSVLVTDGNNCKATATATLMVNALPVVSANGATVCLNSTINLTAGGGTIYSWSGPNNYTSGQQNPVILNATANMAGAYVVTVTDANGCTNANTAQVIVNPSLIVVAGNNGPLCAGSNLNLTCNVSGTVSWTGPNTFSSVQQNPTLTNASASVSGTYSVTAVDASGCSGSATTTIIVNPLPVVSAGPQTTSGCAPLCVNFTSTVSVSGNCSWNFGDGTNSNACTPTHCFNGQGTFNALFTLTDGNGCVGTASATVIVFPVPHADFYANPQPATILEPLIHFTNASSGANITSYNWSFGENNSQSTQQNPSHDYTNAGSFPVMLIVTSDHGCKDSIIKIITIDEDAEIFVPNAFTPNSDGTNDIFMPKGEGIHDYKLYIFDRWGNQVFHSDNINFGWDGRYKNMGDEIVQEDVYVWKIEYSSSKSKNKELSGRVSLLK